MAIQQSLLGAIWSQRYVNSGFPRVNLRNDKICGSDMTSPLIQVGLSLRTLKVILLCLPLVSPAIGGQDRTESVPR